MTYCSVIAVLVLVGLTRKRFGHYAALEILSLMNSQQIVTIIEILKEF